MRNTIQKLMCMFLLLGATYVYGQRTAYENKVIEIKAKYLRKFGMPAQEVEVLRKRGDFLLDSALNQQANKYEKRYGNAVMLATLLEMRKEIKEAEKLKTTADLNKEIRAKKESEEYRRKEEVKRKEEERKREEEAEQAKALEEAKKTDLYIIGKEIKDKFVKWAKRGEFEKTEEYDNRMMFQKKEYLNKLVSIEFRGTFREFRPEIRLLEYDPDREEYNIKVDFNYFNRAVNTAINVDVETAKTMKSKNRFYIDKGIRKQDVVIGNGYFFINKFMFDNKYYPITLGSKYINLSDYTLSTDELGLTEYFQENYQIKLSEIEIGLPEHYKEVPKIDNLDYKFKTYYHKINDEEFDSYFAKIGKGMAVNTTSVGLNYTISFTINEDCSISDISVESSSGEHSREIFNKKGKEYFDKKGERAFKQMLNDKICRKPATIDGVPVKYEMELPISMISELEVMGVEKI